MADTHIHDSFDDEISFTDVVLFLQEYWRTIVAAEAVAIALVVGYLLVTPKVFEATAQIQVAQVGPFGSSTVSGSSRNVEEPRLLNARLRIPTTYGQPALEACGLQDRARDRELLVGSIVTSSSPVGTESVVVKVRLGSPGEAEQCTHGIFGMIKSQQKEMAEASIAHARQRLTLVEARLVGVATSLIAQAKRQLAAAEPRLALAQGRLEKAEGRLRSAQDLEEGVETARTGVGLDELPSILLSVSRVDQRQTTVAAAEARVHELQDEVQGLRELLRSAGEKNRLTSAQMLPEAGDSVESGVQLDDVPALLATLSRVDGGRTVVTATQEEAVRIQAEVREIREFVRTAESGGTRLVSPIYVTSSPVAPKMASTAGIGLTGGLCLGLLVAVSRRTLHGLDTPRG